MCSKYDNGQRMVAMGKFFSSVLGLLVNIIKDGGVII